MIEVQKMILEVMKKQRFASTPEESAAARSVLGELKTKQIDLRTQGEIDALTQHKLLGKMKADRENSAGVYRQAGREDLAAGELRQATVIGEMMKLLEPELPKALSGDEVRAIIAKILSDNSNANMGTIMQAFKGEQNLDRKMVSEIAKEMLKK